MIVTCLAIYMLSTMDCMHMASEDHLTSAIFCITSFVNIEPCNTHTCTQMSCIIPCSLKHMHQLLQCTQSRYTLLNTFLCMAVPQKNNTFTANYVPPKIKRPIQQKRVNYHQCLDMDV